MTLILTILVGAFLLLDGIAGLTQANSFFGEVGRALGARSSTVNMIIAIVELIAGALLLLSLVVSLGELERFLGLAIAIAWIVVIVLVFIINNFAPDTLGWWIGLIESLIILAVIWLVRGQRA
ncbi:MAG: hypothetical protein ACOC1U_09685 [Spirochaetota bacterium]